MVEIREKWPQPLRAPDTEGGKNPNEGRSSIVEEFLKKTETLDRLISSSVPISMPDAKTFLSEANDEELTYTAVESIAINALHGGKRNKETEIPPNAFEVLHLLFERTRGKSYSVNIAKKGEPENITQRPLDRVITSNLHVMFSHGNDQIHPETLRPLVEDISHASDATTLLTEFRIYSDALTPEDLKAAVSSLSQLSWHERHKLWRGGLKAAYTARPDLFTQEIIDRLVEINPSAVLDDLTGEGVFEDRKFSTEAAINITRQGSAREVIEHIDRFEMNDHNALIEAASSAPSREYKYGGTHHPFSSILHKIDKLRIDQSRFVETYLAHGGDAGELGYYADKIDLSLHSKIFEAVIARGNSSKVYGDSTPEILLKLKNTRPLSEKEFFDFADPFLKKDYKRRSGNVNFLAQFCARNNAIVETDRGRVARGLLVSAQADGITEETAGLIVPFLNEEDKILAARSSLEFGRSRPLKLLIPAVPSGTFNTDDATKLLGKADLADTVLLNLSAFGIASYDDKLDFLTKASGKQDAYIKVDALAKDVLGEEFAARAMNLNLSPSELLLCEKTVNWEDQELYRNVFSRLGGVHPAWQDVQNILNPFERGVSIFTYQQMFEYANRQGLSRHDAFHAFDRILALQQVSGFEKKDFFNNILEQVRRDGAQYESGTAHHELNQIVLSFNQDFSHVLEFAQRYRDVPHLAELAEGLTSPADIFASWKSLKRYHALTALLGRTEILDELKNEPNEKLKRYVATLALHPDSAVDMNAAIRFWREPASFLELEDAHTPQEVHDRKKPSNLTRIPFLDLDANCLRDALIEGALDRIQVFSPLTIHYTLAPKLQEQVRMALGSRADKIQGKAKNPGKLFGAISAILKEDGSDIKQYLAGKEIGAQAAEAIRIAISDIEIGLPKDSAQQFTFIAEMHLKSDPLGVLAGNDTVCCMPFGSGKNNVYTFNPNDALFTLRLDRGDGNARTIAQSVITKDIDVKKAVPEILAAMQSSERDIANILPEDILRRAPSILACDNAEVAPNYKTPDYADLIKVAYRDFF